MQWLYDFDMAAFWAVNHDWRSPVLDVVFLVCSTLGLGYVQVGLSALTLFSARLKPLFWPLAVSIAISGLPVTQGLKAIIFRERPSHLAAAVRQEGFLFDSFPSGHTSTSFALAFLLTFALREKRDRWLVLTVWVFAIGVGLSRIYRGVHWPTDCLAGIFSGAIGGALAYWAFRRRLDGLSSPQS